MKTYRWGIIGPGKQTLAKATTENKYILVDCYATWCEPCKEMDRLVYKDTAIRKILDQFFVIVQVQMDSTKSDDENTRAWYEDAHRFNVENTIMIYPTSLFISPEGKLVHKYVGFRRPLDFLKEAFMATDPDRQEYALLEKFKEDKLADAAVPGLIAGLEGARDKDAASQVARTFINGYLLQLPDELLFKMENLRLMARYMEGSQDKAF